MLENEKKDGEPLLDLHTGLNVNTPEDLDNNLGYKFTDVGWNGGIELQMVGDMSQDSLAMGYVAGGILAAGYAETFEKCKRSFGEDI